MMRYDVYDTVTGALLMTDVPKSAALEAENSGYRGIQAGRIVAVEHGAAAPAQTAP
jgi:hypothetical protein